MFEARHVTTSAPRCVGSIYEEGAVAATAPEVVSDAVCTPLAKRDTGRSFERAARRIAAPLGQPQLEQGTQLRHQRPQKAAFVLSDSTFRVDDANAIGLASKADAPLAHMKQQV